MYIIVLAWIYVIFMMSITEQSVIAGILTFLLYGILPLTLILYLAGAFKRKSQRTEDKTSEPQLIQQNTDVKPEE